MQQNNWQQSNIERGRSQDGNNEGSQGPPENRENRMERLTQQITEAKASLHHYVQNSPLRQHQREMGDYGYQPSYQNVVAESTYQPLLKDQQSDNSANFSRPRSSVDESSMMPAGDKSRPSTDLQDLEKVKGGFTEFFSWGNDDKGQLGHGVDLSHPNRTLNLPKPLSFDVLIQSIACGAQHSSFVTHEGHVFTFGSNLDGQLGIDDRNMNQSLAPLLVSSLMQQGVSCKKVACGSYHTMVHTDQDQVYTWGRNVQGQCGQSPNVSSKFFGPQMLAFDASHPVQRIECGDLTSAIVTRAGQLYTFGDNSQGQLGLGNGVFRSQVIVDKPTRVQEIFDEVIQVSCGYRHTLALTIKGSIYGFGSNRRHEMGLGDSPQAVENNFYAPLKLDQLDIHNNVHVAAGGFSASITDQNELIVWGTGQFGVFSTPQKVCMDNISFSDIQISKQESSFAITVDQKGAIYSWGPNFDGQLGQGDFNTRTLPTWIEGLRRKQVRTAALGDRFAIAIGKDVSLETLKRREEAKVKRQQENKVEKARDAQNRFPSAVRQHQTDTSAPRFTRDSYHQVKDDQRISASGTDPPSHRRLNSMHQKMPKNDKTALQPTQNHNRSFDNMRRDSSHHMPQPTNVMAKTTEQNEIQPQSTTAITRQTMDQRQESVGRSASPIPSQTIYKNFQMTQNLNKENQVNAPQPSGIHRGSNSPLRQRSHCSGEGFRSDQQMKQIAVGGQDFSAEHTPAAGQGGSHYNHSSMRHKTVTSGGVMINNDSVTSPCAKALALDVRHSQHKSPYGPGADSAVERHHSELERLFHIQLDEKENVIRQQQSTIQELRVQLTADARTMQNRIDELNDKFRIIERERNDLRTRLASELRSYQLSKEELLQNNNTKEEELQQERVAHQGRENRLYEENKNREMILEERHGLDQTNTVNQLEEQHRNQYESMESSHRNQYLLLEEKHRADIIAMERQRDDLQNEIQNLRNIYDHEHNKVNQATDDIQMLENDKRQINETVLQRGLEIRDLQESNERIQNHLKAVEIEKDTIQERMQVTVSQMNQDISELQKSIGLQNVRLDEGKMREEDLNRQLDHERNMVGHRDRRIDEMITEITCLRKQIEDQNYRISDIDAARSDLNQRFEDLRIECSTQQEKLKNLQQVNHNQENQLQTTRLQLERERTRADTNQNDLDAQHSINNALRRDLTEEQRRVTSRESDIQNLEHSLNHLKDSMGQEFAAKSRDFENLKKAFDELLLQDQSTVETLNQRNDELDSSHTMNRELQNHSSALLDKIGYMEREIAELEDKNKRVADMMNQQLIDRAENYKQSVLAKLSGKGTPSAASASQNFPDQPMARPVSPFNDMTNHHRSSTPVQNQRRAPQPQQPKYDLQQPKYDGSSSANRLAQILQRESGYGQRRQETQNRTPIRGHEIDLTALATMPHTTPQLLNHQTVSMTNIGGPSISPNRIQDSIPQAIFTHQTAGGVDNSLQYKSMHRDSLNVSNSSPLRSRNISPQRSPIQQPQQPPPVGSLRERESLATQMASMNHSAAAGLLGRGNPHTQAQSAQYSPLRSKTPDAATKQMREEDAKQLQNQSIAASDISHRVMMNELKNLRGQIADVQRQKVDLEGRLSNYEVNQV